MKRLFKGLVCTVSVVSLIVPDFAMAATQMQREPQNTAQPARGAQTRPARPARPSAQRPTARPAQVRPNRPSFRPTRPAQVRPNRPSGRPPSVRPPTYRPGQTRPSTFHRIRVGAFHYPRGYRYRRFRIGLILPALFLSRAYFFNDYYTLGIGPPPPGYVWVRYGPDLLLVNRYTGRIVDVIYGAFY
jgi:Ni/Co efflux regulator RcnB